MTKSCSSWLDTNTAASSVYDGHRTWYSNGDPKQQHLLVWPDLEGQWLTQWGKIGYHWIRLFPKNLLVFTAKLYLQQQRNGAGVATTPPPTMCVLGWENGMCGRGLMSLTAGICTGGGRVFFVDRADTSLLTWKSPLRISRTASRLSHSSPFSRGPSSVRASSWSPGTESREPTSRWHSTLTRTKWVVKTSFTPEILAYTDPTADDTHDFHKLCPFNAASVSSVPATERFVWIIDWRDLCWLVSVCLKLDLGRQATSGKILAVNGCSAQWHSAPTIDGAQMCILAAGHYGVRIGDRVEYLTLRTWVCFAFIFLTVL